MMFLVMGKPRPVPPRLVVKYGSNTRARSARSIPAPVSATAIATVSPSLRVVSVTRCVGRSCTACLALTMTLTSAARRRSASVSIIPTVGSASMVTGAPSAICAATADSRQSRLMSASARSKVMGRAKSSTSFTTRFRRTTSPSMSAALSRISSAVAVGLRSV